jgi:DNA polymerase-3 subunit gamma/tau
LPWTRSLWTTLGLGRPFGLYISEDLYSLVGAHPGADAAGIAPGGIGEDREEISLVREPVPWLGDTSPGAEPDAVAAPLAVLLVDNDIPPGHQNHNIFQPFLSVNFILERLGSYNRAMPVLYRKWRPQTLTEVVGQELTTRTLLHALETGRVAHAYLFCGPRGTGKTSTGRILAKAVNCINGGHGEPCNACPMCLAITEGRALDVVEVDAASNRGIDEIRDLREKVAYAPGQARHKVYIIDEVHMLTDPASNALLKTLEEPPPYAIFILCTTEPHRVLPTILSRCQRFDFRRIPQEAVVARLAYICEKEGMVATPEALKAIARAATGSLRDAENILEQAANYYGPQIGLEQVRGLLGLEADVRAKELARYIVARDLKAGLSLIYQLQNEGVDLKGIQRGLVEYLRDLLLVKGGSEEAVEATTEEKKEMKGLVAGVPLGFLLQATRLFAALDLRQEYSPLPLELALAECLSEEAPAPPPQPPARPIGSRDSVTWLPRRAPKPPSPEPSQKETPLAPPPPQPVAEKQAEPIPPPPTSGLTLEYLHQQWKGFVKSLRGEGSSGTLDAMLRGACEPVKLEGDTLELGFYYKLHMEKIEDPKYRFLLEKKLREVFSTPLKVRCSLIPKGPRPPQESLVKSVLEMGARIVDEEEA